MIKELKDLDKIKEQGLKSLYPKKIKISVGMATCGIATGAKEVYEEIEKALACDKSKFSLAKTGCLGLCQMEPLVDVFYPRLGRLTYKNMSPKKARDLVACLPKVYGDDLLCKSTQDTLLGKVIKNFDNLNSEKEFSDLVLYQNHSFFSKQKKIVLRNCGFVDPDSIEEYIVRGGYYSLMKTLSDFNPNEIIEKIKKSGLRGRGGAGFPTGKKWEFTRSAPGNTKYIICNADEGDPGAYMDRSVLEGDPHSVIEGMIIGAYAIGANQGFIYVRTEYPLVIRRLNIALSVAREKGILGKNIFNSGFDFDIQIREGSGAFVCGEETSLIASIEGISPEPRQRPPFPAISGLWNCPTNINNVETWANIPVIVEKGSDWFSSIGTEKSKGTKVFSIVGQINNTGLVEVPMGITLGEIIYDIGGGIPKGKKLKAVQTGGPSGGCIPEKLIDLAVDYESLQKCGSIMGSGGMVVMDESTCIVDIAKFFINFTTAESCGKCTSCRDGSQAMLEVLTRITQGQGKEEDLTFLEELGEAIKDASLCGLGQTLPNPVLSTLRYFKDEYLAHIKEKCCPAGVCKKLTNYYIDPKKCQACSLCAKSCPVNAISGAEGKVYVIDQNICTKCGSCFDVCPDKFGAIVKISGKPMPSAKAGIKIKKK